MTDLFTHVSVDCGIVRCVVGIAKGVVTPQRINLLEYFFPLLLEFYS